MNQACCELLGGRAGDDSERVLEVESWRLERDVDAVADRLSSPPDAEAWPDEPARQALTAAAGVAAEKPKKDGVSCVSPRTRSGERRRTLPAGRSRPALQQARRLDRARRRAGEHAAREGALADRIGEQGRAGIAVRGRQARVAGGGWPDRIPAGLPAFARARARTNEDEERRRDDETALNQHLALCNPPTYSTADTYSSSCRTPSPCTVRPGLELAAASLLEPVPPRSNRADPELRVPLSQLSTGCSQGPLGAQARHRDRDRQDCARA